MNSTSIVRYAACFHSTPVDGTGWRRVPRERYRKAAELSRVRGKLSCLLINDLDAGLGHFKNTQVTVNNQVWFATCTVV
jgi:hypothetical protein